MQVSGALVTGSVCLRHLECAGEISKCATACAPQHHLHHHRGGFVSLLQLDIDSQVRLSLSLFPDQS
jgi:hypothetical protein